MTDEKGQKDQKDAVSGKGAGAGGKELAAKDIVCLGHLKRVFPLLEKLHDVGCERLR